MSELVNITVDGKQIAVPKGMNLIQAALLGGIEIPYYCYHPHLSIAGNCRMCQVEIQGSPKLGIACNTTATEGLVVKTHLTSAAVSEAQRATLEFLLINHPLDCTVCDAAGHCKLQDYYYEYNTRSSRFTDHKVNKVKANPLGPEVIYDGERCIMCTRCVRFCSEITETSELGAFNRGDRGVIGTFPGKELDNPFSGTVNDLCPVGALTHRRWRFNTRIWNTTEVNSVCSGCSTGCNVRVAVRDDKIVYVKGRLNSEVNKEWLCDEGRYGFDRFSPSIALNTPLLKTDSNLNEASWNDALSASAKLKGQGVAAVFFSPTLTLEEMWAGFEFVERVMCVSVSGEETAVQYRSRSISEIESKLISPDYAANARGFSLLLGQASDLDWRSNAENRYLRLLERVRQGLVKRILLIGDFSILDRDLDEAVATAITQSEISVMLTSQGVGGDFSLNRTNGLMHHNTLQNLVHVVLPIPSLHEKGGLMVNKDLRIQRLRRLITPTAGSVPVWSCLNKMASKCGIELFAQTVTDERGVVREMSKRLPSLNGLNMASVGDLGVDYFSFKKELNTNSSLQQAVA